MIGNWFRKRREPMFALANLERRSRDQNIAQIQAAARSVYLGDGVALCRVLGRYKMYIDTRDFSISPHLVLDGFWELWVTEAVQQLLKPGMTAVDIGANLGYFTLLFADIVGPSGKVAAFEPNPEIARLLRQSVTLNGFHNVAVHQEALGDGLVEAYELFVPEGHPGGAYVLAVSGDRVGQPGVIAAPRMDSYLDLLLADLVKIDAEGAEEAIWRGMGGLIESGRPLIILLEFAACRYNNPVGFIDVMIAAGFTLAYVSEQGGVRATTKSEILDWSPLHETMLVLRRGQ